MSLDLFLEVLAEVVATGFIVIGILLLLGLIWGWRNK